MACEIASPSSLMNVLEKSVENSAHIQLDDTKKYYSYYTTKRIAERMIIQTLSNSVAKALLKNCQRWIINCITCPAQEIHIFKCQEGTSFNQYLCLRNPRIVIRIT